MLRRVAQGHESQAATFGDELVELRTYKPSTWKGEGVLLHFHGLGRHPSDEIASLTHLAEGSGHMVVALLRPDPLPELALPSRGDHEPGITAPSRKMDGRFHHPTST